VTTQLFFRADISDYSTGNNDANLRGSAVGWTTRLLSTTRGATATSVSTSTVAGTTLGVEVGAANYVWYSPPLDADVTISGSVTWNLRMAESDMNANCAGNGRLEVIDGATGAITLIDQTARTTEMAITTETAINFAETPAAGIACKRGDRLRVRVFADDAGTMGASFLFTLWFDGPTAAASGDSYLTLTENLTFVSEPAGSQVFPTDTVSDVATASVDREAWTSRGAGVQTDITNTAAGWTAPIQVTDTAGGTVVDWFTKALAAFTLGGAVRCNIRGLESNIAANATARVEIAVVAGDGTGAVAWGATTYQQELTTSESALSFLVSGDDVAVTAGQRLRIRVLIDDASESGTMAASQTVTTYYAGTSGGASGDTYLTFTQTLTENAAATSLLIPHRHRGLIVR
jgi:hypothetical protein